MKKYILSIIIVGISAITFAQNSIHGIVSDTENNPLFGVEIFAPQLHTGTTTDLNGYYEFKNLPKGKIEIAITFIGYQPIYKTINLQVKKIELNILLEDAIFGLDEVILSAPFYKLQSENVMKVEYVKAKTLKRNGAVTLIEGLESIAGVSQISTGTSIGKPVIRGLSGNRVLVYAQGVRLENQQFGGEHGLGVNQAGIESIEVIKGPASLLYGSDALGGVIYFNPEKFASEATFEGDFGQQYYSNTQGSSTTLGFKQSFEKWKFLVRGAYDTHLDYEIPEKKRVTNTRYNELNFNTGIRFNNEIISSELRYNLNTSNLGLTEGIEAQSESRILDVPFQTVQNQILSLHNHIFLNNSSFDIDLGYTHNNRNEFEDHEEHEDEHEEEEGPALSMKLKTFNYNLKYNLPKMKNFEAIIGIQGMEQTNTNFGEELLIPDAEISDFGMLATGVLYFEKSALQGGIRFDNRNIITSRHEVQHEGEDEIHVFNAIDKSYNNVTASLGYKFDPLQNTTVRINLATGHRAPNLAELTSNGVHHGTNRFEMGNNDLKSEQNFQTDISLEYKNEHLEFFVNGFYNKLDDYIFLNPTGEIEDDAEVFQYAQDNAKLYGGEIGFHLHPHPLDWLHLESTFETVIGKQTNGDYLPLIPANTWKNTFRTEFENGSWLSGGYSSLTITSTFKQTNVSDFETPTDGYTLLNFGIGGEIHLGNLNFEVTANANNLFDTSYISHLSRLKSDNINAIGRNIILGINFKI
ncbi:MAG: iron complex outermembrane receptor protein [Porticoccaceae bacterium]|jgi:iron complex outermembrane receptor protein